MEVEWRGIVGDDGRCARVVFLVLTYGQSSCGNLCRRKGRWDPDGRYTVTYQCVWLSQAAVEV
jgi:hypothetical protein